MKISREPYLLGRSRDPSDKLYGAQLRHRLLDTIDWCAPRANVAAPRDCLRSEPLRPYLFNESRHESVEQVGLNRHEGLVRLGIAERYRVTHGAEEAEQETQRRFPPDFAGGRVLVWHRDLTIDDGVGEAETGGFLDDSDMPPWDTWLAYLSTSEDRHASAAYLVSWVPREFVQGVGSAIACNAYDALFWLTDCDLLAATLFRREGILH